MIQANLSIKDVSDPRFRSVCEQILARMEKYQVPGVAVGILCGGVEYTAGFGITNIDRPLPVTSTTLFQIGSTSKTFTATAAMRLVEQGKLDLDAPLRTYLPDLRLPTQEATQRATLRHLLTHTGGWLGDHMIGYIFGEDAIARYVASLKDVPVLTGLGETFSYSNSGFTLTGRLIEVITGKPFETALRELVLDPLELTRSYYFMHEVINQRFASGHTNEIGTNKLSLANPWPRPRTSAPSGGIITDVHDQLKYARFVMGDGACANGTRLLNKETFDLMRAPQVPVGGGLADHVGLCFLLHDIDGVRTVGHGGATNGQKSAFQTIPSKQFAVIILTNSDNGGTLHREMAPVIYETFLGLKAPEPAPIRLSAESASEYAGRYQGPESQFILSVAEDCRLVVEVQSAARPDSKEPPPQIPLIHADFTVEDKIRLLDPPMQGLVCDFVRGPNKEIRYLRVGGRVARRL